MPMTQKSSPQEILVQTRNWVQHIPGYFLQPLSIIQNYNKENIRADFIASLTVAIVLLPQAIAYALIAELPASTGLYAAIVAALIGGLWGSSFHLHTGPTNTTALLVLSGLLAVANPGEPEYLIAAGVMAFWAGIIRLVMGVARLGVLVNFVSDSVVIGFTAGAGILIVTQQLRHLIRVSFESSPGFYTTLSNVIRNIPDTHWISLEIGGSVIIALLLLRRFLPKLPAPLLVMIVASAVVWLFGLDQEGVSVLGEIPRGLPPFRMLPLFDLDLLSEMMPGIIAVALIGLIEAASISRAIASRSGQYLNSDQEFIGQGLANVATGFFSGFPVAGSLTRSAVNYEAGSRSQLSAVMSASWTLMAMLLLAPAAAFIPRPALAGVIVVTGSRMININGIRQIFNSSRGDTVVMFITFVSTLLMPLEYAVLTGILVSFAHFIATTSTPTISELLPEDDFESLSPQPEKQGCPQLSVLSIMGSLYFGAAPYVEDAIRNHQATYPEKKFLLLRFNRVNHMDISGIHMLETVVKLYRDAGGDVFLTGVRDTIQERLDLSGVGNFIGPDHILNDVNPITHIFSNYLQPAICVYQCPFKVWKECQSLPKSEVDLKLPPGLAIANKDEVPSITPKEFWQRLSTTQNGPSRSVASKPQETEPETDMTVIDIREPAEYNQGHLRMATHIPMHRFLSDDRYTPPQDQEIVFVCRNGRRSSQLVNFLQKQGYEQVYHLKGGMTALEIAALPKGGE